MSQRSAHLIAHALGSTQASSLVARLWIDFHREYCRPDLAYPREKGSRHFGILDLSSCARSLVAPAQIDLARHHVRMQTVLPGTLLLE